MDSVRRAGAYPEQGPGRDKWVVARRGPRVAVEVSRPSLFLVEEERDAAGQVVKVATLFLTNRECPYRCVMCDLWRHTLTETIAVGAIPEQIDFALSQLPAARQIKLYNSGSFFDPRAIPPADYPVIAGRLNSFERVIVEAHPSFIDERLLSFRDLLAGKLEVAMGLETAHPAVLEKLNKHMTLASFAKAARFLHEHDIALRVFILVAPPFLPLAEALTWSGKSLDFAFDCQATVCSLIPTRAGNGALDALAETGQFSAPSLSLLEEALAYGVRLQRGRVLADLWDLEKFSSCPHCFTERKERLREMNLTQSIGAPVSCVSCLEQAHV